MGCDAGDIGLTVHPHPTLSETVAFAAEAYDGTLTDFTSQKGKGRGGVAMHISRVLCGSSRSRVKRSITAVRQGCIHDF